MKFLPIFGLFFCATATLANPIINQEKRVNFKGTENFDTETEDI